MNSCLLGSEFTKDTKTVDGIRCPTFDLHQSFRLPNNIGSRFKGVLKKKMGAEFDWPLTRRTKDGKTI